MNIQFPRIHPHILPDPIEQYTLEEDPDFIRFEIRDENLGTRLGGVGGPFGRLGEGD